MQLANNGLKLTTTGRGWFAGKMGQIESLPLRKTLEKEKDRFDLHVLNVQNITIEEKDAERLANLFKQQTPTKLQMIQLGACNLTPNSLSHLAEGITDTIVFDIITRIDLVS